MGRYDHAGISDQRKASLKRRLDALRLSEAGPAHSRGAAYLAGYGIECKIKVALMERFNCRTLTELAVVLGVSEADVYQHGLESLLVKVPRVYERLKANRKIWREFTAIVNHWRPSWRYNPHEYKDVARFIEAVESLCIWLENNHG